MNSAQAKQIPIAEVLFKLGYSPQKVVRGEEWYLSPFRDETEPSFKLTADSRGWYDHGSGGKGGNIIDFAMQYYQVGTVSEALKRLDDLVGAPLFAPEPPRRNAVVSTAPASDNSGITVTSVDTVKSKALLNYLTERGIPPELAQPFVKELHYRRGENSYYTLAFPNQSEGSYELRNFRYKGTYGTKAITLINGVNPTNSVSVFEGFFDFLSGYVEQGNAVCPAIVMNSIAMKDAAIEAIRAMGTSHIVLYLDRDARGQALAEEFKNALTGLAVVDGSERYAGFKDYNEYWMAQSKGRQR